MEEEVGGGFEILPWESRLIKDNKTVDLKVLAPLKYFKVLVALRSQISSNTRRRTLPGLQSPRASKRLAFPKSTRTLKSL